MTRAEQAGDSQPMPAPNDGPVVHYAVVSDLLARMEVGVTRYGVPLTPHNGRNALLDAYEEVLDLACYLKQRLLEEESAGQ